MPNYVKVRITVRGRRELIDQLVEQVKSTYKDEEGEEHEILFDFNKVIPMPESLDIIDGSDGHNGMKYLILKSKSGIGATMDDFVFLQEMDKIRETDPKRFDDMIDLGQKYLHNIAEHGFPTWHGWRVKNWGTKWNACDTQTDGNGCFEFDTAWAFPFPVIEKLAEMYPDLDIDFIYADEECGYNTGEGTFSGGEIVEEEYPDPCTESAYEIYDECWQNEDFYKDPDGEWRWHDKPEEESDGIKENADPISDVLETE
jgi:hypothetical protein